MTSVEITDIRIRRALAPLRRPLRVSFGEFTHAPFLLIDLETKGGVTGRVLAFTFSKLALKLVPTLLEDLAAFARGRAVAAHGVAAFHDACQKRLMLLGHEGVTQLALSMFDMAVHDALARTAGVPLYAFLGAQAVSIPAYNSCGLGLLDPDAAAREAQELVREHGGFTHIKMRLGRARLDDDIAAIRAVREAVGPGILVSCDFNQALPAARALEACRAIDGLGLAWIEEPVAYDDYATQARLTAKLSTPVQIGETWWSWRVGTAAIAGRASDYIMPDILRIGGVTGWMRVARAAEAAGVPFSSHLSPEFSAHALAATPTRHWLEFMDWGQELITDPLVPRGGYARPRDTPGAGIEWNESAVARCLVEG